MLRSALAHARPTRSSGGGAAVAPYAAPRASSCWRRQRHALRAAATAPRYKQQQQRQQRPRSGALAPREPRWARCRHASTASSPQQAQWAGAVSQLVELASEHQQRSQPSHAVPADPWEEGARASMLEDALELLRELAQRDAAGKLHDQHVLSDVAWALASLGAHDHALLEWLQAQALAAAEGMHGVPLARVAWAMGHLNVADSQPLLYALGQRAETLLLSSRGIRPTHVSQLAWACTVHGTPSSALQAVVLAARTGAWREDADEDLRTQGDLSRLHPFLLDLQLQGHPAVAVAGQHVDTDEDEDDGELVELCQLARRVFVQASLKVAQQRPSGFQVRSRASCAVARRLPRAYDVQMPLLLSWQPCLGLTAGSPRCDATRREM